MDKNTKTALLIGGAAVVAFSPDLIRRAWNWLSFNPRSGQAGSAASALAVAVSGARTDLGAPLQAFEPTQPAPSNSDHLDYWSRFADNAIGTFANWVSSVAAVMVNTANNQPTDADGVAFKLPNASPGQTGGLGQTLAPSPVSDSMSVDKGQIYTPPTWDFGSVS